MQYYNKTQDAYQKTEFDMSIIFSFTSSALKNVKHNILAATN